MMSLGIKMAHQFISFFASFNSLCSSTVIGNMEKNDEQTTQSLLSWRENEVG